MGNQPSKPENGTQAPRRSLLEKETIGSEQHRKLSLSQEKDGGYWEEKKPSIIKQTKKYMPFIAKETLLMFI